MHSLLHLFRSRSTPLFLCLWIAFGAATCAGNLRDYTLQQMGVDALVAHRTFALGLSPLPKFAPGGDTFEYRGRTLAAKQPGQFVWGAIPYTFLRAAGYGYEHDYDRAAALVTWLSAGLLAALSLAAFERTLRRRLGFDPAASLLATLALGIGSTWLAYSGIAHHDMEAAAFVILAMCAMVRSRSRPATTAGWVYATIGGIFLGWSVFTSMLPAPIVAVLGLYGLTRPSRHGYTKAPRRLVVAHAAGCLIGVAPLLAYNAWYFGSPFVPANVAGDYSDTYFRPGAALFFDHVDAYVGLGGLALWKYAPALAVGLIGLIALPARLAGLGAAALLAFVVHFLFVTNIETLGTCSYGPRYLIPAMPFLAMGLAVVLDVRWRIQRGTVLLMGAVLVAAGLAVNLPGAVVGTMNCDLTQFAFLEQAPRWKSLTAENWPLLGWPLLCPIAALLLWVGYRFTTEERGVPVGASSAGET